MTPAQIDRQLQIETAQHFVVRELAGMRAAIIADACGGGATEAQIESVRLDFDRRSDQFVAQVGEVVRDILANGYRLAGMRFK